ncbi:nucleotidyltransferase domain-containing protein [Desulfotomaculum copahuensis]|uniref:Polymerase nucleotidyl transferase domain-containing protein n=1 Tax=Desulfotomaculum copahuensis TaxID=1838280 RepID=A0A1B7LD75_9FIRM|nr:nucleotidyltransferase domain-containing protein [Desulfotomaculum copahuensis]OAT81055.1 hypothetical protein A6M21_12065 [Desulfotomaculum copahuensis]
MPQTSNRVNEIVRQYLSALSQNGVPIQAAYLFGSQAKGTAGPYSDIDLIVISKAFKDMPQWRRWEILGDALAEVMEPIEVRGYTPEEIDQAQKQRAGFLYEILSGPETVEYRL